MVALVKHCPNCLAVLDPQHTWGGLCSACAMYAYRTGRDRPERLWRRFVYSGGEGGAR